jgi:glutamine phosphoribosylpyrophosphate amidotransferase
VSEICGIVGVVNPEGLTKKQIKEFIQMLIRCQIRGTDASGAFNSRLEIVKSPGSFKHGLLRQRKFAKFLNKSVGCKFIVGHTRMATQGTPKKNSNNHPFRVKTQRGPLCLVHNGWLFDVPFNICDTIYIIRHLKRVINRGMDFPEYLYHYNEMIDGEAVLAIGFENRLILSRSGHNTLVFDESMRYFASTAKILGRSRKWILLRGKYHEYRL